jgi:hypothetical protein
MMQVFVVVLNHQPEKSVGMEKRGVFYIDTINVI